MRGLRRHHSVERAADSDAPGRPRARPSPAERAPALAGRAQDRVDGRRPRRGGDDHHADAAVEGAQHLGLGDAAGLARASRTPAATRNGVEVEPHAKPSGSTRGMLSGKPPPVMCASALMPVGLRAGPRAAASHRCASASSSASPSVRPGANGAGASQRQARIARRSGAPARSRWSARPRTAGRAPRRRRATSGAAAACRARPRRRRSRRGRSRRAAYRPGISAVSPPISAQPASPAALGDALDDRRRRRRGASLPVAK